MDPQLAGQAPQQLADACSAAPGCVGFTSDGRLKSAIKDALEPWPSEQPAECDGIYVATARSTTGKGEDIS